jgi:RNA polymerase sigma-54 factor
MGRAARTAPALTNAAMRRAALAEHLDAQIGTVTRDAAGWPSRPPHRSASSTRRAICRHLLRDIARDLGVTRPRPEAALALVQSLDPTGVGARNLGECIALQAKEADRYDPCMARLIDNLDLVARGELARLKRLCGVDDEDFADMLAELRGYDPKPGLRFGGGGAIR